MTTQRIEQIIDDYSIRAYTLYEEDKKVLHEKVKNAIIEAVNEALEEVANKCETMLIFSRDDDFGDTRCDPLSVVSKELILKFKIS